MVADAKSAKKVFEIEKKVKMKALEKKRKAIIPSYPVGNVEWMKELKKNSR